MRNAWSYDTGKMLPSMCFAWAHDICKFVNYSITKYIPFHSINNQQKHTFDQCQIKLGFMETVSEIVLYVVQDFLKEMKVLMAIYVGC